MLLEHILLPRICNFLNISHRKKHPDCNASERTQPAFSFRNNNLHYVAINQIETPQAVICSAMSSAECLSKIGQMNGNKVMHRMKQNLLTSSLQCISLFKDSPRWLNFLDAHHVQMGYYTSQKFNTSRPYTSIARCYVYSSHSAQQGSTVIE
jgi:hypothetical protein